MMSKPESEHEWLQQLVGTWAYETECVMGPDKPMEKFAGTETVRSVGGFWLLCEAKGKMPDGEDATMFLTVGYDSDTKRYVGTWFGSMMSRLWVYDITREGNTLNMESDGPSFTDPKKMVRYRDALEIKSSDHRVFTSSYTGDDGKRVTFMTAHYRRVS